MRPLTLASMALLLALFTVGSAIADDHTVAEYRDTLDRYCITCHNEKLRMADLTLDLVDVGEVNAAPHVWER